MSEISRLGSIALLASITRMALRVLKAKLDVPILRVAAFGDLSPVSGVAEVLISDSNYPVELKFFGEKADQYTKAYQDFSAANFDCVFVIADNPQAENNLLARLGLLNSSSPFVVRWNRYLTAVGSALQMSEPPPTCLNFEKIFSLFAAAYFAPENGATLECGVYLGGTTVLLALLQRHLGVRREILAFDTFKGLPPPVKQDYENPGEMYPAGFFANTSLPAVIDLYHKLGVAQDIRTFEGLVGDTLAPATRGTRCSFALLDMDQYMGTHQALSYILQNSQPGTLIIVDDTTIPGVSKAIDEACAGYKLKRHALTGNFEMIAVR